MGLWTIYDVSGRGKGIHPLLKRKHYDLSFSPTLRRISSLALFNCYKLLRYKRPALALGLLLKSHRSLLPVQRIDCVGSLQRATESAICWELAEHPETFRLRAEHGPVCPENVARLRRRGIVLKTPRIVGDQVIERGVLLLKHTEQFLDFSRLVDVGKLLQSFTLVLEPSSSGYADASILFFATFPREPVVVMATEGRDFHFLERLKTNLTPVSFGASDWVNPETFHPIPGEQKTYDAIMVAMWGHVKRHHVLFRALREMRDASYRLALIGFPWMGSTRQDIEKLIDWYGVRENVEIFENLPPDGVNKMFNRSRVNLMLSLREGSNKTVFEGFFAGVPGLALRNNIGMPKDYFTPETGKLVDEEDLASELLSFRENWNTYDARTWATANIAPEVTAVKLSRTLRRLANQNGEQWTCDIVTKCNNPELQYWPDPQSAEFPSMESILSQYARKN